MKFLTSFYNFLKKEKYAKLNPFKDLNTPPKAKKRNPKLISNDVVRHLLQCSLNNKDTNVCLVQTLSLFCGLRVEEAMDLQWQSKFLEQRKIEISDEIAKGYKRRVVDIPENAFEWLVRLSISEGSSRGEKIIQQLKRFRRTAKKSKQFEYPQNGMRHSFAGNHIAQFRDAKTTSFLMGHPDATLVGSTYHEFATRENAAEYWGIIPEIAIAEKDDAERIEAEERSPYGEAIKGEGIWQSVTNKYDPNVTQR